LDQYLEAILKEICAWRNCGNLSQRTVTTVHFGGGTPLFLGHDRFQRLVEALKTTFNIKLDTEWAIETTSASLTENTFAFLYDLGFRRVHLGVQSMEEQVRPLLKRRESAHSILKKIEIAQSLNWVTSVDLLVGLPYETPRGFLTGLTAFIDAGCDGFSVYEINISSQNIKFANQYNLLERDRRENYFLFLAALTQLSNSGFKKNLFNHYANKRDQNLYFTFPERGEDCLAIGAYADGVFVDYHYRHSDYQTYIQKTSSGMPAIEGGIRKTNRAKQLFPLEIAILSGEFTLSELERPLLKNQISDLIQSWEAALLVEQSDNSTYALTPNGAWFAGNMVQDLESRVGQHV
jgi:coproporphyrinogen III oxidase-like Fe-S oxidoreductase